MKKYWINSKGEPYYIKSDDFSYDGNGLKFYRKKELIAVFTNWDSFFVVEEDMDETESPRNP